MVDVPPTYEELHRDLTRRLGFGDNVTEPQADNDTIVAHFDRVTAEASEWHETQLWRLDCLDAGHPDDEDCYVHDPSLRLYRAEAQVAAVEELCAEWETLQKGPGPTTDRIRAAL